MKYFKYKGIDYVAIKRRVNKEEYEVDVFCVGTQEPTEDRNIQYYGENLFLDKVEHLWIVGAK